MIPYHIFMKHAEKVTKNVSSSRPILKGVVHQNNGDLVVTDSHRLYVAKESQSYKDNRIVEPKTGQMIEGNYPVVSRLIPSEDGKYVIQMDDIRQTIDGLKCLIDTERVEPTQQKKTPKNLCSTVLKVKEEKITLCSSSSLMESEFYLSTTQKIDTDFTITFRSEYLEQALSFFKECGYYQVDIHFYDKNRPFVVKSRDNVLLIMILPIKSK